MRHTSILFCLIAILLTIMPGVPSAVAIPPDPLPPPCERPKPPPRCFAGSPSGTLTAVTRVPTGITVSGSASDPDAPGTVMIVVEVNGRFTGRLAADGPGGGFSGTVAPQPGTQVCVWAINRNRGDDHMLGCRDLIIRTDPFGHLDGVHTTPAGLRITGWVIDPDTADPTSVRLFVDGQLREESAAGVDRPDVAAAYPGYGSAHGFDITLAGPKRHNDVCATGVNVGIGSDASFGCGRDPRAVSVLSLNIRGTHTEWSNDNGVGTTTIPWRDRYRRLGDWMAETHIVPDIIALQEVPARKQYYFPWPHLDPGDYESLFILIEQMNLRTGGHYRIAYFGADYVGEGWQPLYQGRAMLYNADRVRNTTLLVNSWPVPHDDTTVTGVHMRKSFPCAAPPPQFAANCSLLDGDGQHWVSAYMDSAATWTRGPGAAVFELHSEPGKNIIVTNVHAHPEKDPGDAGAIRALVDQVWNSWLPRTKLMPPIVAGDFNGDPQLPDFDVTVAEDVDFMLNGKSSAYASVYAPVVESTIHPTRTPHEGAGTAREYCGTVATVLSDHCSLFAQYLPVS